MVNFVRLVPLGLERVPLSIPSGGAVRGEMHEVGHPSSPL